MSETIGMSEEIEQNICQFGICDGSGVYQEDTDVDDDVTKECPCSIDDTEMDDDSE